MSILTGNRAVLADLLFSLGAVKFGAFRLKLHETQPDAPLSPFYFELRTANHPKKPGPLTEEAMSLIGEVMVEALDGVEFDCYTGLPAAGEPFADEIEKATAGWSPSPLRVTMVKVEEDGKRWIDHALPGSYQPGDKVVVIDDLVTQADTKLEGAHVLENLGLDVVLILVLIDREQGGMEQLRHNGYEARAIFSLEELISHYLACGVITQSKADEARSYVKSVHT